MPEPCTGYSSGSSSRRRGGEGGGGEEKVNLTLERPPCSLYHELGGGGLKMGEKNKNRTAYVTLHGTQTPCVPHPDTEQRNSISFII